MEYLIRACEQKDLAALVELCAEHAHYEQAEYSSKGKLAALDKAIFSETPRLFCLVVEIENNIVGFASYTFDFSTWDAQLFLYLDCLYINQRFRGMKIGDALMQRLIVIAREHNSINMQWQTPIWNEGAIRFYERVGGKSSEKARFTLEVKK